MHFEFATAGRIIFGAYQAEQLGEIVRGYGNRAFILTGSTAERAQPLLEQFDRCGVEYTVFGVDKEPTTCLVAEAVEKARAHASRCVVSIGGGSVLDTGKAVAAMLTNAGELMDYLEVVGAGKKLHRPAAAHIAAPTTAGTGAEVTRNAVLAVPEKKVKVSMRSPLMLPTVALVDPLLTHSMPAAVTAETGMDALTQLIEAFVSGKANPLTDGICREGLQRAGRSLRTAYHHGNNADAREDMALASLFGGLALANAKLGAVHGFAGPLGGMIGAAHGSICAALLPHVMRANVEGLRQREPQSDILQRYEEVARIVTGNVQASATDGAAWAEELCEELSVTSLSELGLREHDVDTAVAKAQNSSSMKGNPIELTEAELRAVVTAAM